jgi:hypothetical protein
MHREMGIDHERSNTEKIGVVCLKIIETFLAKNEPKINEELLFQENGGKC